MMEFRTEVTIGRMPFEIGLRSRMLLVGSCFADGIGRRFLDERFQATVNPDGVMYNPVSVLHCVERTVAAFDVVFLTLGTNHVYREKATGEIVDNCQKRPQYLFNEEELSVGACADSLQRAVSLLTERNPQVQVVVTVSPIRYRKYGYHGSQLSKATLLLAADLLVQACGNAHYFPAYEIFMDELRDYRFYQPDMLHPSEQAVDYVWERLVEACFSAEARQWLNDFRPVKQALAHRPFNPDSDEYRAFMDKTMLKVAELQKKYPTFVV